MYCKNRSWKTQKYKDWAASVCHRLSTDENLQKLEDLRNHFDTLQHYYAVDLRFYYPQNILITKKGSMSAKAHDVSNIEKPLIDIVFLPQFFNVPSPYGCKNLNIDDKFIKKMSSEKIASDAHRIEIEISILPL